MKFVSMIFNYDLDKMVKSGRIWAKSGYHGYDYILEYSAASIATVLHHNPNIQYDIWSDEPLELLRAIQKYDVPMWSLNIIDKSREIKEYARHDYCFWPLTKFIDDTLTGTDDIIKLDNDLTCLKPSDELFAHDGAIVWRHERKCSAGRDYWGESFAARRAFGTVDFDIYNMGVFGLSKKYHHLARETPSLCQRLLDVDISGIVRFPESPGTTTKMWSCSEQTAQCFFLHKNGMKVKTAVDWFDHHCYTPSKQGCIEAAKFLLKK